METPFLDDENDRKLVIYDTCPSGSVINNLFKHCIFRTQTLQKVPDHANLVPRACDPREGNEGSGIIRFREDSDWPLKSMRSSILATIPGFRQRIIPEPSFPSQGSQARGTRL